MRTFLLEESEYVTHPPLTEKMIENAEKKLKVSLPKSYLELLKWGRSRFLLYENQSDGAWSYPEYPSCNWYMIAMISRDLQNTVFKALQDGLPHKTVLIHEPPEFWD